MRFIEGYSLYKFLLFWIFFAVSCFANAEPQHRNLERELVNYQALLNTNPAELLNKLETMKQDLSAYDQESIQLYNLLYCQASVRLEHYSTVLSYTSELLDSSENTLSTRTEAGLLLCRADANQYVASAEEAEKDFQQALLFAKSKRDTDIHISALVKLGEFYAYQSSFFKAQKHLQEAYKLSQSIDNIDLQKSVDSALGGFYAYRKDYEKSLSFYQRAVEHNLALGYFQQASISLYNLGIISFRLSRSEDAIAFFKESKKLANDVGDDAGLAYADIGLAEALIKLNKYKEAVVPLYAAKTYFETTNTIGKVADIKLIEASLMLSQGKHAFAIPLLDEAISVFENEKSSEKLRLAHESLAQNYIALGEWEKALESLEAHHNIEHQLHEQEQHEASQRLIAEFQFEHQEAENQLLKQRLLDEQDKLKQQETMQLLQLSLIIVAVILIIFIVFHLYRQFQYGQKMKNLAMLDELTEIPNRRAILNGLKKSISWSLRYDTDLTIAMIDIDYFKRLNDTYGHEVGDIGLKAFTQQILSVIRSTDHFGRVGGEEFLLIMPHTSTEQSEVLLERLLVAVRQLEIKAKSQNLSLTASFGVTQFISNNDTLKDMLNRADSALYQAKANGRDRYVID